MDKPIDITVQSVAQTDLINSIKAIFHTEIFIAQHKIMQYVVDLYMPRYNIILMFGCIDHAYQSAIIDYMSCTFIDVRPTDNVFSVAGRIYSAIAPRAYGPPISFRPFNPPAEVLLTIVFQARMHTCIDFVTLRSLSYTCKAFNATLNRYRNEIIEHYTMIDVGKNKTTYLFCGRPHRYNDQPAIVWNTNARQWCKHGLLHRGNDMPAIVHEDGSQYWYWNGELHRNNDQPAVINISIGIQKWYQHGKLHREMDRPAVIRSSGTQVWHWRGKYHREGDKPAYIHRDGTKKWYKHGKLHRDNGQPAVVHPNGDREWYKYGMRVEPPQ